LPMKCDTDKLNQNGGRVRVGYSRSGNASDKLDGCDVLTLIDGAILLIVRWGMAMACPCGRKRGVSDVGKRYHSWKPNEMFGPRIVRLWRGEI